MEWEDYIQMGLNGKAPLKIIVCGSIECAQEGKIGVVSVVYVTTDRDAAERKVRKLAAANPEHYYMVYSVPLDTDLTQLPHYPSIEITQSDLA